MDEAEILGLSFLAFHWTAPRLHLSAVATPNRVSQLVRVGVAGLRAALVADRQSQPKS
jgi:hypothetical protein